MKISDNDPCQTKGHPLPPTPDSTCLHVQKSSQVHLEPGSTFCMRAACIHMNMFASQGFLSTPLFINMNEIDNFLTWLAKMM